MSERNITVRSENRNPPDLHKLSRAVIAIALAEANAERPHSNRKEDDHDND